MNGSQSLEQSWLQFKSKFLPLTAAETAILNSDFGVKNESVVSENGVSHLKCPNCGNTDMVTQVVSDVTYRKSLTVVWMMFAPVFALSCALLFRHAAVFLIAVFVFVISLFVPTWALFRGARSVTHKYYVCDECGYVERDSKWKIENNGGTPVEAIGLGLVLAIVLIASIFVFAGSAITDIATTLDSLNQQSTMMNQTTTDLSYVYPEPSGTTISVE